MAVLAMSTSNVVLTVLEKNYFFDKLYWWMNDYSFKISDYKYKYDSLRVHSKNFVFCLSSMHRKERSGLKAESLEIQDKKL